jgi:hypothetical protein
MFQDTKLIAEQFYKIQIRLLSITMAAWSKVWTVFARSNTGIVDSNPTRGMNVWMGLFCV